MSAFVIVGISFYALGIVQGAFLMVSYLKWKAERR